MPHLALLLIIAVFAAVAAFIGSRRLEPTMTAGIGVGLFMIPAILWLHPTVDFWVSDWIVYGVSASVVGSIIGWIGDNKTNNVYLRHWSPFIVSLLAIFAIWSVTSWECFHSGAYRDLLGVETKVFTDDMPLVKETHIRLIPRQTAIVLADQALGDADDDTLSSQLELDLECMAIQEVDGQQWWLIPLDFQSFFKWNQRRTIPGYIRVYAHEGKAGEAELITENPVTGESFDIKYTPGAWFSYWLPRNVYFDFPLVRREECTFEVTDGWDPNYIYSATLPSIGFDGYITEGVIEADPQTGEMEFYDEDIPDYIDRVRPLEQALEQARWWGKYINGFWNTVFAKKGMRKPTNYYSEQGDFDDMWFVRTGDQNDWYTGMTSLSADDSMIGMLFVNTRARTGGATYYKQGGSTEAAIVEAVEVGLGAESDVWSATQPLPYNFGGVPTAVVPVVSTKKGYFQKVALVKINAISTMVIEDDLSAAYYKYGQLLMQGSDGIAPTSQGTMEQIDPTKVLRVGWNIVGGDLMRYFQVEAAPDRLFSGNGRSPQTQLVVMAKEGDQVTIGYMETTETVVPIQTFGIPGMDLRNSDSQQALDETRAAVNEAQNAVEETRDAENQFDKLTPAQKRDLMEQMEQQESPPATH